MSEVDEPARATPDAHPELLPLLPLVYCSWADGVLSADEIRAFRTHVERQAWLGEDSRDTLSAWLDPAAPPAPAELKAVRDRIRRVSGGRQADSLTELGLTLWEEAGRPPGPWADTEAQRGLAALERALGLPSREAARRALGEPAAPGPAPSGVPAFEPAALRRYLDHDHLELRDEVLALLTRPPLAIPAGLPTDEYRERVFEAVRHLGAQGLGSLAFPVEHGGRDDPGGSLAVFETLAFGDLSVLVKFGVQFGLFGGSVLQLGTRSHHERYLARIATVELPGAYAMTEGGHGSNVRDLETTATYDADADQLVVHTPHEGAGKDWIGNAAVHGRMATVFARLLVGGEDHGVHAVLVPIRDAAGAPSPGVRLEDRGDKVGLNGVDNGRIWFHVVRVPTENLLDRFGSIDAGGHYVSPIPSPGRRFFTMLGTLVAGRVSIAAASVSATKRGLAVAIRYADRRRQFGPDGGPEQPILDYLALQRSLMPRLATTLGLHFAVRALQRDYVARRGEDQQEVEVVAAGLKAYASEHCVHTLQACREACGGEGYLAANGFAALKADTDVFTTFEGANAVLWQLVAKGLLSRFRDEMGDLSLWGAVRYLAERAETTLSERNPVATRRTDEDHLRDPDFQRAALVYREERLLRSAAGRLRARIADGMDSFQALGECQDHVIELARAHVERLVLDHFLDGVARAPTPGLSEALGSAAALYALSVLERERGWFLESGYFEAPKSQAIRAQVGALCREVREHSVFLVSAFGVPEALMPAIAGPPDG